MKTYGTTKQSVKENGVTAARNEKIGELMAKAGDNAHGMAYTLTGNVDEARELVQEGLYRVLRTWDRCDVSRSLEPLLFKIIRNAFVDMKRCANRKLSLDYTEGEDERSLAETVPDRTPAILESLERQEVMRLAGLKGLGSGMWKALELRVGEGCSYLEISRRLRVPVGTIRSRVCRAREILRERLAEYLPTWPGKGK